MRNWTLLCVLPLLLAGCGSDDNPTTPAPVEPAPSPTATPAPAPTPGSSAYAGNWAYRTTLTAVDGNCGHTEADIGTTEGPFGVTVTSDGTFTLRDGSQGTIDSAGNVSLTLAPRGGACAGGSGAGGCRNTDNCDGTSVQAGDVSKWRLFRN